jgi:hypothetical protein
MDSERDAMAREMDNELDQVAWFRLVSWSLDEAKRRRPEQGAFVSVLLPTVVADHIAERVTQRGYAARVTDGYTGDARLLTIWGPAPLPLVARGRYVVTEQ